MVFMILRFGVKPRTLVVGCLSSRYLSGRIHIRYQELQGYGPLWEGYTGAPYGSFRNYILETGGTSLPLPAY